MNKEIVVKVVPWWYDSNITPIVFVWVALTLVLLLSLAQICTYFRIKSNPSSVIIFSAPVISAVICYYLSA